MNDRSKIVFLILFGAGVLFSGCAAPGSKASQEVRDVPATTVSSAVQIIWDKPEVPFMILGRVQASASTEASDDALYKALQKEGEKLYANAVVVQQGGVQAVRIGNEIKKQVNGWAISYTSHAPVHRDPTATKTDEEQENDERKVQSGFGLLN